MHMQVEHTPVYVDEIHNMQEEATVPGLIG